MFKHENIGSDLKKSLLILLNKCKEQQVDPEFLSKSNIVSIYKGKGYRAKLENERGIFMLNLVRKIKDKMILNDVYEDIDANMSDSQVGGRSKRGIIDHLFIVYSVINSVAQKESAPVDLEIYDISKMFDALWIEECCNDMYEAGVVDDKMALIYAANEKNLVAVSTPAGMTDRVEINRIITQGGSLGPITAGVEMDGIAKEQVKKHEKSMYLYKKKVKIPSLEMVDDLLNISQCGIDSTINNSYLVTKMPESQTGAGNQ